MALFHQSHPRLYQRGSRLHDQRKGRIVCFTALMGNGGDGLAFACVSTSGIGFRACNESISTLSLFQIPRVLGERRRRRPCVYELYVRGQSDN
jgi:hypothetical protein